MDGFVIALTLCLNVPAATAAHGIEPRGCYELRTFDSKTECDVTAELVKIQTKGARLRCLSRELRPDEKILIARGE